MLTPRSSILSTPRSAATSTSTSTSRATSKLRPYTSPRASQLSEQGQESNHCTVVGLGDAQLGAVSTCALGSVKFLMVRSSLPIDLTLKLLYNNEHTKIQLPTTGNTRDNPNPHHPSVSLPDTLGGRIHEGAVRQGD